jgi:hypothetical protein
VIEQRLKKADCVVAVWSRNSVHSDWVKYEVARATQKGILVPVTIDGTPPPSIYDTVQSADLKDWGGDPEDPRLATVLRAVEQILERQAAEVEQALNGARDTPNTVGGAQPSRRGRGASLATTAMLVALLSSALVLGGLAWNPWRNRSTVPVHVVVPGSEESSVPETVGKSPDQPSTDVVPPAPESPARLAEATAPRPPLGPWFALVGSYQIREHADRKVADLSQKAGAYLKGWSVEVNERWVDGRHYHGVMIEPSTTYGEASRLCAGLRDLGFQCSLVDTKHGR